MTEDNALNILPPAARDLAQLIGLAALRKLAARWGGLRLEVPARVPRDPHHPLVRCIGPICTAALVDYHAGCPIDVPKLHVEAVAAVHADVVARREAGQSEAAVAVATGLTARHVRRVWSRYCAALPSPQRDLF